MCCSFYFSLLPSCSLIKLDISNQIDQPYKFPGTKESVYKRKVLNYHRIGYFRVAFALYVCFCETIVTKMRFVCKFIFMQIELIVIKKVLQDDSV